MDHRPPAPPHIQMKRQELNEAAYCAVLRTLTYKRLQGPKVMSLLMRLRVELGITSEQHQHWQRQFLGDPMMGMQMQGMPGQMQHYIEQQPQPLMMRQPSFTSPAAKAAAPGRGRVSAAAAMMQQPMAAIAPAAQQSKAKRKASLSTGEWAPIEAAVEAPELGRRVQRWRAPTEEAWRTGVITCYRPSDNQIRITYEIENQSLQFHDWCIWSTNDPYMRVLTDTVDIAQFGFGTGMGMY